MNAVVVVDSSGGETVWWILFGDSLSASIITLTHAHSSDPASPGTALARADIHPHVDCRHFPHIIISVVPLHSRLHLVKHVVQVEGGVARIQGARQALLAEEGELRAQTVRAK